MHVARRYVMLTACVAIACYLHDDCKMTPSDDTAD